MSNYELSLIKTFGLKICKFVKSYDNSEFDVKEFKHYLDLESKKVMKKLEKVLDK